MKRGIILGWFKIVIGLFIFSFGVHLTIFANIGLAPWDCLGMGISYHTPLSYGVAMMVIALAVLGIDLVMREKIGYGTIIDALLTGNFIQFFNDINPLPLNENIWLGIPIMLGGFVFMALGMAIYMKSEQGCGPRDALLVGLGRRMGRIPIGFVQIILWAVVLLAGWLLGGPVGIGTIISVVGAGLTMQLVYKIIRFEPRKIRHRSVAEVTKELFSKKQKQKK
ncbi:MAG: hypothetical protein K5655_02900 [Lachnospiraceae bacterium]|nr:hypothetical protein [Lachnospiraceae bacterium]